MYWSNIKELILGGHKCIKYRHGIIVKYYHIILLTNLVRSSIMVSMRNITASQRAQVVRCLVEGNSVRSTVRITGVAKNTIVRLLGEIGCACASYHNQRVRNLTVRRLQCDEVWSFVGAKAKNTSPEKKQEGWGDTWTWVGIDADTKLCVSYPLGGRDSGWAKDFMEDCAKRIRNRVQITTDGHKAYLEAVESAFGADIDYAMLQKIYGAPSDEETRRYSPAKCIGCDLKVVSGDPDPAHVSTSYVERSNLTMRMGNRRFTRLTNAFSKKVDNHRHMVALFFFYYNFCRVHQTTRVTPAMEAGVSDHVWSLDEMCATIPAQTPAAKRAERSMVIRALGQETA
jgi:IS1 family transposase